MDYCDVCGHARGDSENGCTECTKPIGPRIPVVRPTWIYEDERIVVIREERS
jgi:hypothetical protein